MSIGNLSLGGRAKTPLAAFVARLLVARGERPAILSRGYGRPRPDDGVVVVSDGTHLLADVERAGDEPLLLAREAPGAAVFVCPDRALAGTLAECVFGCTVHLLDDGFQHLRLARDVDLVVVAAADAADRVMPGGRLREPLDALASADAVIVDGDGSAREGWLKPPPTTAPVTSPSVVGAGFSRPFTAEAQAAPPMVFQLHRVLGEPVALEPARPWPAGRPAVVAVAGIAEPARFRTALEAAGWPVTDLLPFADHHWYTRRDVDRLVEAVRRTGAAGLLTTSKDAMRLLVHRPFAVPVAYAPLDVRVAPGPDFEAWLIARLERARA